MITDYTNILVGLPVMYLIVVVAMVVVIGAMAMDAAYLTGYITMRMYEVFRNML